MNKVFLGDGVYAQHDGNHLILTTEDGLSVSNEIFLELKVIRALMEYLDLILAVRR